MSLSSLPEEIHEDILGRLPVKSILTCKCVSKLWCNLICSANFVKFHLNIQRMNPRFMFNDFYSGSKNRMNFIHSIDHASLLTSSDLSSHVRNVNVLNGMAKDVRASVYIKGSCNGLVCLLFLSSDHTSIYHPDRKENSICIWNPATREYKILPVDSASSFGQIDGYFEVKYGFGYDCKIDDYKVVRIICCRKTGSLTIQVYTLGPDSWENIQLSAHSFYIFWSIPGLFFNGALHWLAHNPSQGISSEVILSFDISNYTFVGLPFPEDILPLPSRSEFTRNVGVLNDYLCLVHNLLCENRIDIWVMQEYGVRESWTKRFTTAQLEINTRNSYFRTLPFKNGIMIHEHNGRRIILLDKEMDSLLSVDVFSKNINKFQTTAEKDINVYNTAAVNYIESLVSLHSGTYFGKMITEEGHEVVHDSDFQDVLHERLRRFHQYKTHELNLKVLLHRGTHDQAE